ncbi:MAG: TetR/AcrR family transcriptional regulator [Thermoleophilaceae bacterium]|jgi:AcrR family transcriptional regulator|nr:TetR/AcrR family transcriptional regulator [Thermoleophilaceae bacterium]
MARAKAAPEGLRQARTRKRYEGRRQEVADIAARVFAERGYDATSIDDLVEATGLQRGGLYHYMEGKKDLLIRIHGRFIEPLLDESREICAAAQPPDVALRLLARALMGNIDRYRDQVTVFFNEWRMIEHDPEWTEIRASRKEFADMIDSVLERGAREGVFTISDRRMTLFAFLGMLNYSHQWFDPGGRVAATEVADHFCDIFLQGITTR